MTANASIGAVTVHATYRAPYEWSAILAFFRARAIEGVEEVGPDHYRRTLASNGDAGTIEAFDEPVAARVAVRVTGLGTGAGSQLLSKVRRALDTDIDPQDVCSHLSRDSCLAPAVATRPGLRVPGCWDPFELGVRAILGQQISVVAARGLAGRLVALCGASVRSSDDASSLSYVFPTPSRLLDADLDRLGMPAARRAALRALAEAASRDSQLFEASGSIERTVARLRTVPGIGEWTAQYIAMRAAREPDAFPATDVGLLRGAAAIIGERLTPRELLRRAERWRPWRAYAAQHLWAVDAGLGKDAR